MQVPAESCLVSLHEMVLVQNASTAVAAATAARTQTTNINSVSVSGVSRAKIEEVTLNALRTRQSLVKGERLVRTEVRAVLHTIVWGRGTWAARKQLVGIRLHATHTNARDLSSGSHRGHRAQCVAFFSFQFCYPRGYATLSKSAMPEATSGRGRSKLRTLSPHRKIDVKRELPVGSVSVFTLIRTDTTLDHSQKAEKV